MKIIFHLAHPAHYHLFKNIVTCLLYKHDIIVTYNEKDVLNDLINNQNSSVNYVNIKSPKRMKNNFGLLIQFFEKDLNFFKFINKYKPDIIVGTSIIIAHVGKLLNVPSIIVNEDDFDVITGTVRIGYPFCSCILAPECCKSGKWEHKVITYRGYHELTYLSPKYFKPDYSRIPQINRCKQKLFILRLAELTAHHDIGKRGITVEVAREIIRKLCKYGDILITSERTLESEFEKYRIEMNPLDIHHALYYADLYLGDSQTMAAEAAVLGTPSIRFNDFVGKLSYLEELEQCYGLTYGFKTSESEGLFVKIDDLLNMPNLKDEWQKRRLRMLNEKIDVNAFMVWFIENFPDSVRIIKRNPNYQLRFYTRN